ncbi:neuropeptides capa receptor-like [Belonocnema kinseyi]|uniref:neuropeptides capa receptor-like n=1 Tax=Belonocnema kinseyi TaxID=2817044 RepID=UPI00143DED5B|nr:neuropeptides capa receptor-like [Belonocnema kinseyi]
MTCSSLDPESGKSKRLPNEVSVFWQQYPWVLGEGLCKIRAYVSEMSSYVSVLTIVAFSLERYLAICHPLQVNAMSGLKRPIRFIFGAWSIAMISAIPFAIYTKVNYVIYPPDSGIKSKNSAFCAMLLPDMPEFPLYEMSCLVFFFIPMIIIFILYVRMGLKIQNSTGRFLEPSVHQNSIHTESKQVQSRRSIIKMLSAVVIMFFICWAPFHTQRIFYVYGSNADYYPDLNEFLYIFSGFLYYFSTTVNPILYNVMSSRYRKAFKETLYCSSACEKNGASNNVSRLNSNSERRSSNFRSSIRYTIDQAKEMFRLNMDGDGEVKRRENDLLHPDDPKAQALLSSKHSSLRMQSSNASSTSQNRFAESLSTASSIL